MGGNGNGELKGRARRRGLKSCMIGWGGMDRARGKCLER